MKKFEDHLLILKNKFQYIDFNKSLNSQLDSLNQVRFLIEVEKIFQIRINPNQFDKELLGIAEALRLYVSQSAQE